MEEIQPSEQDIKNPRKSKLFVYYKHVPSGKIEDMPYKNWVRIMADKGRRKDFELIRFVDPGHTAKPLATASKSAPPVQEDPFQCPLCGRPCDSEEDLARHRTLKHGESTQINGVENEQIKPESLPIKVKEEQPAKLTVTLKPVPPPAEDGKKK